MAMDPSWYLRKYDDGGIFGPLPFDQLSRWASKARVAPRDLVSSDQETWMKAPMLTELKMDWLVEVTSERYYGPTTLGAIREFLRLGEINQDTFLINSCDGSRRQIKDFPGLHPLPNEQRNAGTREEESGEGSPATSTMSINMRDRINDL